MTPTRLSLPQRLLSLPAVLCAAFAVVVFFFVPRSMADPDIWWHLRDADFLLTRHAMITEDLYSFTAHGAPWMNHEWLAELPFALGWHVAGAAGVYWVTLLVIELILFGVLLLAWQRSHSLVAAFSAGVIATVLSTVSFGPRTLLFGWLCLLAELLILQAAEHRPRLVWALPFLFAVWVNTHGSWMIGLVVLLLYLACGAIRVRSGQIVSGRLPASRLRELLAVLAACGAAVFLNPYGWRLAAYPFNLAFHQKLNISNVEEWRSLDPHSPRGMILLLTLAGVVLLQLCRGRRWRLFELALVALGLYSALCYTRFLFLFAILALPVLAASLPPMAPAPAARPRLVLNAALLVLLIGLVAGRLRHPQPDPYAQLYPVEAVAALGHVHPDGPVFNEYLWGGYMIDHLPGWPVFVDSRVDIFEYNGTFKDYLDIIHLQNPLALLDKYRIRYVFFEKDTPLVYLLERTGGWHVNYEQGNTVLLERTANVQGAGHEKEQGEER